MEQDRNGHGIVIPKLKLHFIRLAEMDRAKVHLERAPRNGQFQFPAVPTITANEQTRVWMGKSVNITVLLLRLFV